MRLSQENSKMPQWLFYNEVYKCILEDCFKLLHNVRNRMTDSEYERLVILSQEYKKINEVIEGVK